MRLQCSPFKRTTEKNSFWLTAMLKNALLIVKHVSINVFSLNRKLEKDEGAYRAGRPIIRKVLKIII